MSRASVTTSAHKRLPPCRVTLAFQKASNSAYITLLSFVLKQCNVALTMATIHLLCCSTLSTKLGELFPALSASAKNQALS